MFPQIHFQHLSTWRAGAPVGSTGPEGGILGSRRIAGQVAHVVQVYSTHLRHSIYDTLRCLLSTPGCYERTMGTRTCSAHIIFLTTFLWKINSCLRNNIWCDTCVDSKISARYGCRKVTETLGFPASAARHRFHWNNIPINNILLLLWPHQMLFLVILGSDRYGLN